jgi:hypothetical protein
MKRLNIPMVFQNLRLFPWLSAITALTLATAASAQSASRHEVCASTWPAASQAYTLIYLDSTDASLAVDEQGLWLHFRDPWGRTYKELAWNRDSKALTVREAPEGILLDPLVFKDSMTAAYQSWLDDIIRSTEEFMWGYGPYTIGERPDTPLHPELQDALLCLKSSRL